MLIPREATLNILFDLDGTLTDSRPGIIACIKHALDRLGAPSPTEAELQRFIGPPLRDSFASLLASELDAACVSAAIHAYRERFTAIGMFENAVYEGIPGALDALSYGGARLYVATSKPRVYAQRILDHFGLADRFAAIFGSELDGRLCDKSELIAHALERTGIDAAATVMIGDRGHDMLGAVRNGVFPAGALWGYGTNDELRDAGAKRLLGAPGDIPGILSNPC
jgi:phosphoglycolate phosphatase